MIISQNLLIVNQYWLSYVVNGKQPSAVFAPQWEHDDEVHPWFGRLWSGKGTHRTMSQMDGHLKRIERIGGQMRIAVWILMLATPVGFVATIYWDGFVPLLPVPHEIAVEVAGLSVGGVLAVVVLAALKPTTFLLALWFLQDLFGLYRRGLIFEAQNVQRLRHLGWALIGIDLAEFLQRLSVGPLLSFLDAAEPFLTVGIGLSLSIVGVFAIVIAKIMDLGRELKEFEELAI